MLVRFGADGSVDQSFGQQGFVELAWEDGRYFRGWARLADGRLASVVTHPGSAETVESQAWWLHSFTADGSPAALRSTGSVRLGLNVLNELSELVPTSDGALLMIGRVQVNHARGPAPAVRRILPDGSLDPTFGRKCGQPLLRAYTQGGASTPDGGVLVSTGILVIPYDATGALRPGRSASGASAPGRPWFSAAAAPCWERPSSTPTVWPAVWR